jgi:hypothetical protein
MPLFTDFIVGFLWALSNSIDRFWLLGHFKNGLTQLAFAMNNEDHHFNLQNQSRYAKLKEVKATILSLFK